MHPLIYKASVRLTENNLPSSTSLGDEVQLRLQDDGNITVILVEPSRLPFGLGRSRELAVGTLGQHAKDLLKSALETAAHLRVRVVELEPAHLSCNDQGRLFISVWGDPQVVSAEQPRHPIFSRARIHDNPVIDTGE